MREMMEDLTSANSAWRAQPFPKGSDNDALDEIHAELATWDTWIASVLLPYIDEGRIARDQVDVAAELKSLASRAAILARGLRGEQLKSASAYRAYVHLLMRAYHAYLVEIGPAL
jgi:hypothetical protein